MEFIAASFIFLTMLSLLIRKDRFGYIYALLFVGKFMMFYVLSYKKLVGFGNNMTIIIASFFVLINVAIITSLFLFRNHSNELIEDRL